ncbi:cupin domain-containing protein [Thalassobaculum sp.]|uniref:cupin domain-containing protein n=1 Tax=Thalassobaculum sp. TaxID=2022740 RepID=UPI0032ECD9FB
MPEKPKPPAFEAMTVAPHVGNAYPAAFAGPSSERIKRRLSDHGGLTHFGVNHVILPPRCQSSVRHWHTREDEFVMVLTGTVTLVTDAGEQTLGPGMCAAFPAGRPDGHALLNRTDTEATYLEVGGRVDGDEVDYPDVDMQVRWIDGDYVFVRRSDGTPY